MACDSRVTIDACVNVSKAVFHVDSLKCRGSSKGCALSCFWNGT